MKQVFSKIRIALFLCGQMLKIAYNESKWLTIGYFASASIASLFRVGASVAVASLIDRLGAFETNKSETLFLLAIYFLGLKYFCNWIANTASYAFQYHYFEYLMRYKLQNAVSLQFYQRTAKLDMEQLENPQVKNDLMIVQDNMLWAMTSIVRVLSYALDNLISIIVIWPILANINIWVPIIVILLSIPNILARLKWGHSVWSIYSGNAPDVKKLWYFGGLFVYLEPIREMKIFGTAKALLAKYQKIQNELYYKSKANVVYFTFISSVFPLLGSGVMLIVAYNFLPSVHSGILSVGTFVLLLNLSDTLYGTVGGLVMNISEIAQSLPYAQKYFDIMNMPQIIKNSPNAYKFDRILPPKIEFVNVSFAYPGESKKVLKNVSFVLEAGENLAIVGENGAGKSTIIKLLCRFYDPSEGKILINGHDLRSLDIEHWRAHMGTLFQEFTRFHFSVAENIILGSEGRASEEKIMKALTLSGADKFVKELPREINTQLGKEFEDGVEISGGQWQKLAISRAFYRSAPLLILDEPTSAIDALAEYEIFNNLEKSYANKSLILVSHRFSTVKNAQNIIVLDDGEIVEMGNHQLLLKAEGIYAKMYRSQSSAFKE